MNTKISSSIVLFVCTNSAKKEKELTNSQPKEYRHHNIMCECRAKWDRNNGKRRNDQTKIIQQKRVNGWEIGHVTANNTTECIRNTDN